MSRGQNTMSTGYRISESPESWYELREEFEWTIPDTYNIASATLDRANPDSLALHHVDESSEAHSFTYDDLARASDAVAARFARDGIGSNDRVAVCFPQCPEFLVAYLAIFKLGAQAIPLSVLLGDEAVAYTLRHSDASAVVMDRTKLDDAERIEWPDVEATYSVEVGKQGYDHGPVGGLPGRPSDTDSPELAATAPDDPALVLYTSGTTGRPKGVVQSHQYLIGSLPGYQCYFHLFDRDAASDAVVWSPSEWAWAGALFNVVFPTMVLGGTVASKVRRSGFDPADALSFVERITVTHAFMPPTALQKIRSEVDLARYDLDALRVVQCGGEKLPPSLLEWAEAALDITVNEAYGQTEANALVGNCQALFEAKPGSIGRPYPGHEVRVVDADGDECDPGTIGEIAVNPPDPVIFEGYLNDKPATAEKFLVNGLFRTDDMAIVDEDGYVWHRGRRDDLIITSGYRVSPLEVETALEGDPAVAEAAVVGVPDDETGERIKAYLLLGEEKQPELEELFARLGRRVRRELAAYKVPDEFEVLEAFPATTSDKTDRSALFE